MAFVVEDGTGLLDSNSYSDLTFADAYFADRANAVWAAMTNDEKKASLIAATDYIDTRWGRYFKGEVATTEQALLFPRDVFVDVDNNTIIPVGLKKATAEYALRAFDSPLAPDVQQDPSGFQVSRRIEKVGPLEERTDFAFLGPGAVRQIFKPYPAADLLIYPFLRNTQGRVIRN